MSEAAVWTSVTVNDSEDLKQDILAGRLNMFHCPSCSYSALIPSPMLYRDDERRLVISFYPSNDPIVGEKVYNDVQKTSKESGELSEFEGYNLRFISDYNELLEKILIFDNDMNDKAIEVIKLMILMQDPDNSENRDCRFGKCENDMLEFVVADRKENMIYTSSVPKSTYDTIYKNLMESGVKPYSFDWERVNGAYATKLLNGYNN